MKKSLVKITAFLALTALFIGGCNSSKQVVDISDEEKVAFAQSEGDTIDISNEKTEYEITIIEPGFNIWLSSIARPEGYYSQSFMENRNQIFVTNWNIRVLQPQTYNSGLYQLRIDYEANTDYGYEVNYKLYNYFIYFQRKYGQRLGPFVPRI